MSASWWTWLPSLRPLKGLSNFFYIWANWDTISEEQRKKDERLHAVEDVAQQMIRLKERVHEEERRALERTLEQEREKLRYLASHAHLVEDAIKEIEARRKLDAALREHLDDIIQWMAIVLYVLQDQGVRDHILSALSPPVREALKMSLHSVEQQATADHGSPTPPSLAPPSWSPPPLPPPSPPFVPPPRST